MRWHQDGDIITFDDGRTLDLSDLKYNDTSDRLEAELAGELDKTPLPPKRAFNSLIL